jgi:hypothetical protein
MQIVSIALWILQGLLAALFLFAGAMKLVTPADMLTTMIPLPELMIRFVGIAECLGAVGLILPGLLRIHPQLAVFAAVELVHVMIGATILTLVTADTVSALMPVAVGCLCAAVAYGRYRQAPHQAAIRRSSALPLAA